MNFNQVGELVSNELQSLAGEAGLIMLGVASLVWIVGQKRSAKERVVAIVQGLALAILGPIAYNWFFTGLQGLKGTLAVGTSIVGLF